MIEPGYYNVIYDELGDQQGKVVSWHGHFRVWGINEKTLKRTWQTSNRAIQADNSREVRCA
jgi:hypothetical protein